LTSSSRGIHGLYAITEAGLIAADRFAEAVEQAILGGARLIQYRDKSANLERRLQEARVLNTLCKVHGIPLIINDDVELAVTVSAAGVHLGKDDADLTSARARLGESAIIGVSCYDRLDLAVAAEQAGADYAAFGSFFSSPTKPAAVRADVELLRTARRLLSFPIVAIGGITPANGSALVAAVADCLAVISGVFGQDDVRSAARAYAELYDFNANATPRRNAP
jgi:thiamine-phosphate pyrophosphorylase